MIIWRPTPRWNWEGAVWRGNSMKIGIISDIHGNAEAFTAVLAHMDGRNIARVISLGDNIGYGPDSEKVLEMLCDREILSVMGNHELAATDARFLKGFNPTSRMAVEIAIRSLSSRSLTRIRRMEASLVFENARFVHGFPPNAIRLYIFQVAERKLRRTLLTMPEDLCFIGHTHDLSIHTIAGEGLIEKPLKQGKIALFEDRKQIISAGSVGQPRDGDLSAKYLVWDPGEGTLAVEYVPYDARETVRKMKAIGIPAQYAERIL